MPASKQIVCVGFPKWEGDYMKSTVLLMSELAKSNEVLYVDYPYTWKDVVMGVKAGTQVPVAPILGIGPRLTSRQVSSGAQVHVLTLPPFLPANWLASATSYDRLLAFNARLALSSIKAAMKQLGFEKPIHINAFNPALGNALAGKLDEQLLVYYCYDEISAANWISKHGSRHEQAFLSKVDLTIVSSAQLLLDKGPLTKRCKLVKNGVSLSLFQNQSRKAIEKKGIRIGYLGSIDERLDFDLLYDLAIQHPEYQFQFVGRVVEKTQVARLAALENCEFLGPQAVTDLSGFVAGFQVGLIPFKCNKLTAGIYPLKINEYLAVGVPVITTPFTDLSELAAVAYQADTAQAFSEVIPQVLAEDTADSVEERKAFATSNSWQNRALDFGTALTEALEEKMLQPAL